MVIARNEETGVSGIFPVSAVMKGESTALRWLTLADANGETSRLGLTGGHPMFVVGAGWVQADEVVEGDRIRNADLRELTVLSVDFDPRPQIVHNLEVADAHTYFAGEFEAWGHNSRLGERFALFCVLITTFINNGDAGNPRDDKFSSVLEGELDPDQIERFNGPKNRKRPKRACPFKKEGSRITKFQIRDKKR